uniref:A_deaminase domain-containing protein n=1 Tax=Steinernema glaseri TaxID=37863 RepID=A0A1I7ZEW5_9BILA
MLHPEAVLLATKRVIEEFAADGVIYLELRTTPKATPHMTKMDYVNAIVNGIKAATSGSCDIVVRVLLSIDRARGLKDAKDTVELLRTLVEQNEQLIVGLDLSGNPKVDGRQYIELLEEVRAMGLKVTLHLAELSDCVEELDSFIDFQPDRIGHGTFIHSHGNESTVRSIIAQRVPFEICLSSNQLCGSTKSIADSHCKTWRKIGNPVCLSTDDKGLMGTDLSNEYFIAAKAFDLTETDLIEGARTSLNAAFISHKDPALQDLHEKLDLFEENPQVLP